MDKQTKIINAIEKLRKAKYCFGICSDVSWKDFHVLFFDFDNISLANVTSSLKKSQKEYDLSDIYIVESCSGFNAICLDEVKLDKCKEILDNTKYVDPLFIELGYEKNQRYILRMDIDKKVVHTLKNKTNSVLSNAHRWFFMNIMYFPINEKHIYDDNFTFRIVAYKSVKHGVVKLYD